MDRTIKKATLLANLKDLEGANLGLLGAIKTGLSPEIFKELIEDYANILENVRLSYNENHGGIINGIQKHS